MELNPFAVDSSNGYLLVKKSCLIWKGAAKVPLGE
jgi:hypothetical protein